MSDADVWYAIRQLQSELAAIKTPDTGGVSVAYTPTYNGATPGTTTYTFQDGTYVRIGDVVIVRGQINWSAATGTGNAQISLPFAAVGGNFTGSLWLSGVTFAAGSPELRLTAGDLFFTMISPATNAAGTIVAVEAVGSIIWTLVYFL